MFQLYLFDKDKKISFIWNFGWNSKSFDKNEKIRLRKYCLDSEHVYWSYKPIYDKFTSLNSNPTLDRIEDLCLI